MERQQTVERLRAAWDYVSAAIGLPVDFICVETLFGEEDWQFFEQYGSGTWQPSGDDPGAFSTGFSAAYSLLTRYEEWLRKGERDVHGRFPGKASLAFHHGLLDRPVVDEYASELRRELREKGYDVPEPERQFRVRLTHDVDFLSKYSGPIRALGAPFFGLRPFSSIPEYCRIATGRQCEPFDTFDWMISQDNGLREELGEDRVQVVYYFLAGGKTKIDVTYDVSSLPVRDLIRKLSDSGATIGLHVSYDAGLHPEKIGEEKAALEEVCGVEVRHSRHHYLTWRSIEDGWALARAGITDDSTLGYADVPGFRLGTCQPVPLFDPAAMRSFGITEHPLQVMDRTLSDAKYLGLSEEEAFLRVKGIVDQVKEHQGELVLLWHNNSFGEEPSYHRDLYVRILREIAEG